MRLKQHSDQSVSRTSTDGSPSAETFNHHQSVGQPDESLRDGISHMLTEFIGVPRDRITISVAKGHVTLQGIVDSYYRKQLAQAAVLTVDGVTSVHNNISVVLRDDDS